MTRPLRIEYGGACYHVMNRGNQRRIVFRTDVHHELFLDRLGKFALQFGVDVHAFCLMPNHFHLLLTTQEANLSRFMQGFLTSFSISINRMRGVSGHVFQGRFRGELVEAQRYLSEASRYIHLNPLRTGTNRELDLAERRDRLHRYRWSSFGALIGVRKRQEWLDPTPVLSTWGVEAEQRMKNYCRYVEQGLTVDLPNPFLNARERSILGSDSFVDMIRRRYLLKREVRDSNEEVALRHLRHSFSVDDVLAAVRAVCEVEKSDLLRRRSTCREARRLAMYAVALYCRHSAPLAELARRFGVTTGGLCSARDRVKRTLENRKSSCLKKHLAAVVSKLEGQNS